jgi:two-component system CheB/CheR fusion protein
MPRRKKDPPRPGTSAPAIRGDEGSASGNDSTSAGASAPAESVPIEPLPGQDARKDASVPFPVVAIGASAGGIEAITRLLEALPTDTGMAFVVVQHLSPAHESMLAEILGRATRMPVAEAKEGTRIEANHVYVIPPNRTLAIAEGALTLSPRVESRGQVHPINEFMRSLAEVQGYKAIGVVLSGSANDGTVGLEEIKAAGGITFAQDITAEQSSMPRSAVAAGVVDFVLPPDEIAHELARIARRPRRPRSTRSPLSSACWTCCASRAAWTSPSTSATRCSGASRDAWCCTRWTGCANTCA